MRKYKILNKQTFTKDIYSIVPIRYQDRSDIMKWRNEQMYHLRQNKPLTREAQDLYFDTVVNALFDNKQPSQILFSFLENGTCIGYGGLVHINWIDKNAEISFIMNTELEGESFQVNWINYLSLIEEVAFLELNLHKIFTYAFDLRPHLYEALESANYRREATLKEHCFFNGEYKDVVIHSKVNLSELSYRKATLADAKLLFDWANEKAVREASFYSSEINWDDHLKWFNAKIEDNKALILLFFKDNAPIGQARIEQNKDVVIGISIDSNFRGLGFAKKIIDQTCQEFWLINGESINAYIKPSNKPSISSFEKAGFSFLRNDTINESECLVLIRSKSI